ncbi:MAG: InlB B-repeat-containing protein, partial [Clostridia bacterium]|nr:InlB B-repeat-containing protein [Clostridia bacterium]
MKAILKFKKTIIAVLSAICLTLFAIVGVNSFASTVSTKADTVAESSEFFVYGASVRVVDENYNSGIKFHVLMTADKYEETIENSAVTGTLMLPKYLLGNNTLTVSSGSVSNTVTTDDWKERTVNGTTYMESVVFLYNIPASNYGSEIAVRAYIKTGDSYEYTEQKAISMSQVALTEYNNASSKYYQNSGLKTYLDKTVTYHIGNTVTTETVTYGETLKNVPSIEDGYSFYGWYTKNGTSPVNISSPVKNNINLYAKYRKDILLTTQTHDLSADVTLSEGETVSAITYGNYSFGTALNSVTVPDGLLADTQNHGEQTITVTTSSRTVEVPVLFITQEISTATEFTSTFKYSGTTPLYGYYRLSADITGFTMKATGGATDDETGVNQGFRGTFDGNGKTISGTTGSKGMFQVLGTGSVIKNLTVNANYLNSYNGAFTYQSIFARSIYGTAFTDVTVNVTGGGSPAATKNVGLICSVGCSNNTFTNVIVNAEAVEIGSLFGGAGISYVGYESKGQNTYSNVVVKAKSLTEIGNNYGTTYSVEDESGITLYTTTTKVLDVERQEILLTDSTYSISSIDGFTILGNVTFAGNNADWGNDLASLTIDSATLSDPSLHGEQYLNVYGKYGNTVTTYQIPVTLITKTISSFEEFYSIRHTADTRDVFGYYVVTADFGSKDTALVQAYVDGDVDLYKEDNGFRGTFDGRGHTLTFKTGYNIRGLFGQIGTGAVIKNIILEEWGYSDDYAQCTLARRISGATLENITISVKAVGAGTAYGSSGVLTDWGITNSTLKNVTIDAT